MSWLRLRQIALVAEQLAPVEQALVNVLGAKVCYRDPGVAHFGLENALLPIGNQLLEVVAPTTGGTAGGRYLQRRGGDGGYMVITQCDAHAPRRDHVERLGIRLAHAFKTDGFINMQLHPKDTGGTFFEIDEQLGAAAGAPDGPWEPAGPDWQRARVPHLLGISAAEIQADAPAKLAARWGEIAQLEPEQHGPEHWELGLDNARLRFVPCRDGRPEGLGGIDIRCSDPAPIIAAARQHGLVIEADYILLGGMRLRLQPS